ncbi:lysophospholipid acyltransferase family protein [Poseidonibacter ostreae]|uniref:1-acyl-sn-glycerol-3-phosphate acyltransferase n=1 Tax=Poseidonibacter ostreae TaxID=2654171 RepID=A0A6L4WUX7_9BACT|nr:lysophospholipid acyltransferase family protein [Poseidonibacter ostreae]KAB7884683.1 1-acylglycerol-3-phosphate O-acyltransferase [Poseidonibacter ostreae]KAB7889968.1 1-acylglycerol-3-phosphate O-acyltransferase [Poseidonibacter ostreae]KAB7891482.1 1-acylglycerol-3-phosphate O-acyltransferase [Poseidonibacter ostreae]
MNLKLISMAFYATYLTNKFGFLLKNEKNKNKKMLLREEYAKTLLKKLKLNVNVINKEKLPIDGKYLLISNHRSIIDPLIIETALKDTKIRGFWIAKKELYNSFFFGMFTRNAGSILLDREAKNMAPFFKDIKEVVKDENSIYIFPEGTRNKQNTPLSSFKEGARIIALKNRLPILPVYIKTNANEVLKEAINSRTKELTIDIEIGELIDYKDKTSLEENYRKIFDL